VVLLLKAEAASVENTGVVSASNQEQVSEQSVSASNHTQTPVVPAYYRQVRQHLSLREN
jgi:hypothetical protein